jgi:biotin transport system substrate-specific component
MILCHRNEIALIPIDAIVNPSFPMQSAEVLMATLLLCLVSPLNINTIKYSGNSSVVPVSLQSLAVLLLPSFLGSKRGCLAVASYLFCGGILKLPVFAKGAAGRDKLVGPTGGFLWAFLVGAFYMGTALECHYPVIGLHGWVLRFLVGHLIILTIGFLWLRMVEPSGIPSISFLISDMIMPLIPGLCLKTLVGATLANICNKCLLQRMLASSDLKGIAL